MKNKLLITFMATFSFYTLANTDLTIDGARWEAENKGYNCGAFTEESKAPTSHQNFDVKFEKLVTDITLDNGLILATFTEEGASCNYSAILLADNAASTIKLVNSKAFAVNGNSDCLAGKTVLDESLADNDYLYWGHPHHVTVMMPAQSAANICGEGTTHIGLDFVVSKFLGER